MAAEFGRPIPQTEVPLNRQPLKAPVEPVNESLKDKILNKISWGRRTRKDEILPSSPTTTEISDNNGLIEGSSSPHTPEERSVITEVRLGIQFRDMEKFLHWYEDDKVKGHIDPLPRFPDWNNPDDVEHAKEELYKYFNNITEDPKDSHRDVQPVTAINQFGETIGVVNIRWRGDPYVPKDRKIASIERLAVDPDLIGRNGIGTQLLNKAEHHVFDEYQGYNGQGAEELRAWVMTDPAAGEFHININMMLKRGYEHMAGLWSNEAKRRGIETDREAMKYRLTKDDYLQRESAKQILMVPETTQTIDY